MNEQINNKNNIDNTNNINHLNQEQIEIIKDDKFIYIDKHIYTYTCGHVVHTYVYINIYIINVVYIIYI